MLQDTLCSMLKGNKEFYMIDSQNIIHKYALRNAMDTINKSMKNVVVVKGGPGTGKSVLAINLLVELNKMDSHVFMLQVIQHLERYILQN